MQVELLTQQDLEEFGERLKEEFSQILHEKLQELSCQNLGWLRGSQVKELLGGISESTLKALKDSGKLKSSKLNGTSYYKYSDIVEMMERHLE